MQYVVLLIHTEAFVKCTIAPMWLKLLCEVFFEHAVLLFKIFLEWKSIGCRCSLIVQLSIYVPRDTASSLHNWIQKAWLSSEIFFWHCFGSKIAVCTLSTEVCMEAHLRFVSIRTVSFQ